MKKTEKRVIAINRKASRSYIILEKIEAGVVLVGTEVKSVRAGKVSLAESYGFVKNNEVFLKNMHIRPYEYGNVHNHDPLRIRKLLLHRSEIERLSGKINERGLTLIATKIYLSSGKVKVELALAKGKIGRDRREDVKKREAKLEIARAMKRR